MREDDLALSRTTFIVSFGHDSKGCHQMRPLYRDTKFPLFLRFQGNFFNFLDKIIKLQCFQTKRNQKRP